MRILLDDQLCDVQSKTVGDAITGVAEIVRDQGRLIVEVVVDGQLWTSEQLDAEELVGSGADEVRLTSALPRELASHVFADAGGALDEAEQHQARAAEMIQSGQVAQGLQEFGEALSLWLSVQQAVEKAAELVDIDLAAAEVGGETGDQILAKVQRHLQALKSQVQSQDMLGVADTLLYDLPEVLQEWRELLAHLAAETGGE